MLQVPITVISVYPFCEYNASYSSWLLLNLIKVMLFDKVIFKVVPFKI